jgi:hypothetical protein
VPKITIRPTKLSPNYKRVARTGGSSEVNAVADQSDASYIRRKADKAPMARYLLAEPAIPANADIATIVPGARLKQPTSRAPKHVTVAISAPGKGKPVNHIPPTVNGPALRAGSGTAIYTYATPAAHGKMAGPTGPWANLLSKLAIRVNDGHAASDANRAYIYELFADVYYAVRPDASVSCTPPSPLTTTCYPELTVTLTALIESWQDDSGPAARTAIAYELKVFDSAQYTAPGFDPTSSPCFWSTNGLTAPLDYIDGATPSSESVPETPDYALPPDDSYRVYARGRRIFTAAGWGAWSYITVNNAVIPPSPPTLSGVRDDTAQRVVISATPIATSDCAGPLISIERSPDGGATWTPVRGATKVGGTFGVGSTFFDYEAPRGTALLYRANVEATNAALQLVSSWSTAAVAGTFAVKGWNIKAPLNPSLNVLGAPVIADPEYTQEETAVTFRPMSRKFPVVVSMALGGADGSMVLAARSAAEWARIAALRDYQGTLLLESPFGWSHYIRILSRSWVERGAGASIRRRVSVSFLEVDAP